jgi:hypothetical protein
MKSLASRGHRGTIVLLLVLLAFAFAVEGSQPAHSHEDGRLGVYNAECPLAELTAVHAPGWVPEPLAIESPELVALPVAVTSSGWVPSPFPSLTDSRAPPLV